MAKKSMSDPVSDAVDTTSSAPQNASDAPEQRSPLEFLTITGGGAHPELPGILLGAGQFLLCREPGGPWRFATDADLTV